MRLSAVYQEDTKESMSLNQDGVKLGSANFTFSNSHFKVVIGTDEPIFCKRKCTYIRKDLPFHPIPFQWASGEAIVRC